ncbi:Translation initiation factor eIF-2B subunit epsilon [Hypsizygus marmoreus]|uniref:Translation initiation factor eIF2B subunit epsilon n=1 Tax=Hypsizygus marmoreus TaxID=39966 RepID=A0A369JL29_HYPMA|nr:Translation initiation factor eIF-2B subunit epsilon [Hypsizygus marmoreus]
MAPKSSSSGKEKLIDADEEVLQAVILADSFNKRFRPLTTRKPRCLLPICNAPLLDWTFESLALAGVQEIFVVCRSHAEQVKAAIKESKWSKPGSGIKIVPILTAKETFSPGDAMRDIYTRGLVTSDFVLVMGDLVSNIRIDEVVKVHKERRKTNKDAIMTMVVKESGAQHRTKARGDSSVFVLDAETSECLYYESVTGFPKTTIAHVPREVLASHPEIEIRNDLIDCSIDICSVEVPSLFQDNFDYLDIRRDFVHGVLTSDLLMKSIHCYVAKDGYAARVKDTKSYESVSKDILSRWTFPLVPDDNHPGGHIYDHERGNKYIAKDHSVILARTCKIGNNTLIGSSTQINENAQIIASVIGENCVIGTGSIIRNSYIFDGTVIGADCVIERSIIGANVTIKDSTQVQRGCLIGDGVVVGPFAKLKPFERLSKKRDATDGQPSDADEEVDSDLEDVEAGQDSIQETLGKDSNALVWPTGPPDVDAEEDEINNYKNERFMRLGDDASDLDFSDDGSVSSSSESESDEDDSDLELDRSSLTAPSDTSLPLNIASAGSPMAEHEFRMEVAQSLERAFAEGHSVDNAAVELKTLRMASNVPLTRVREAVVAAIVEKIQIIPGGPVPQRKEIASVIGRWGGLINRIGGVDPVETITALQTHCASSTHLPLFGQILAALYQDDIVEEDDIRKWHAQPASKGEGLKESENIKKCWIIGAHMIKQFDEQESDDDEEEETTEPTKPVLAESQNAAVPASSSEDEDEDEEDEDEDEDEDEESASKDAVVPAKAASDNDGPGDDGDDDNDDDDDDDDDEESEDSEEEAGPSPKQSETPSLKKSELPSARSATTALPPSTTGPSAVAGPVPAGFAPTSTSVSAPTISEPAAKQTAAVGAAKDSDTDEEEDEDGDSEEDDEEEDDSEDMKSGSGSEDDRQRIVAADGLSGKSSER